MLEEVIRAGFGVCVAYCKHPGVIVMYSAWF